MRPTIAFLLAARRREAHHLPRCARARLGVAGALSLALLALAACESGSDDPGGDGPPIAGDLAFWSYPDGRHVTGTLEFTIRDADFPGFSRVESYVDDQFQGFRDGLSELVISVDARPFDAGPHSVMLVIQTRETKAEYRYRGELVFDHTAPSAGRLVSVALVDDHPVVTWELNEDANFASYRIRREALGVLPEAVFAVKDRATTELVDTDLPAGTAGVQLEYSVAIHNGYEAGPRDGRFLPIGDFLDLSPYPGVELAVSPADDHVYMVDDDIPDKIVAFSTSTNVLTDDREVEVGSKALACAPDGQTLVYADANSVDLLDAQTLEAFDTVPYTNAVDAVVASDGRVFVARGGSSPGIDVFDAALDPVETIDIGSAAPSWLAVSSDAKRLYVINANPRTNPLGSLLSFDVTSTPASPLHTRDLTVGFVQAVASPSGDRVYLAHTRSVEIVSGETLAFSGRYETPGDIIGIAVSGPSLYVSFGIPPGTDELPRIERADRQSLARQWTWRVVGPARNLAVTRDDARLYAYVTSPVAKVIGLDVR